MRLSLTEHIEQVDARDWNNLARSENPFLSHEFLHGLEITGCVGGNTGWEPNHLILYDDGDRANVLLGAVPLYLKYHSWGEYVFDWAWADAYQRSGLEYYPKLLCAIPFTPVSGPRLLINPNYADAEVLRSVLADGVVKLAHNSGVSSLHVLFSNASDNRALEKQGLMLRAGSQFHWQNRDYEDFEHYLASFTSSKRKKIRREKRRVAESGIEIDVVSGDMLKPVHWDAMYRFYRLTVENHGAAAYLKRGFFEYLQAAMRNHIVLILARDDNRYIGGTLNMRGGDTLYGRYWGADANYDGLHFEACYYQPIEFCIRNGIRRFEAGAQGEHKLSRGLLPTPTYSAHWLRDSRFRSAIAEFLQAETEHIDRYNGVLHERTPFRSGN